MYNPHVISQRLERIQKSLKFQLQEYSVDFVHRQVDYINSLINFDRYEQTLLNKGKTEIEFKSIAAKNEYYASEIQQFITNEAIVSKWNCWYWMERYYKISDITNTFVQYAPNDAQKIWMRIHSRLEGLRRAIRTLDEKARQVGKTTFAQGVTEHRLQFFRDVKSMIASKDETSTGKMADMFIDSLNKQPFWLRPQLRNYERGAEYKFDNGSGLYLGWGTQDALAKGTTCTVSHLSEIALFKYPVKSIQNALIRAMHETIWLLQIFEGTAETRDDWFHKYVKETIKGMERGTSSLYFSFIPYFVRSDIYPPPAYISGRADAFANFIPTKETIRHAEKARNWVLANPDMREVLGSNYRMSRETMFWYQTEKQAAIDRDELGTFLSQVPADWEEAFQHAGKTIYPIILINEYGDKAQGKIPEVFKLRGDPNEISPDFFPTSEELHESNTVIPIKANHTGGAPPSWYELVRIKFEGWDKFDPINKILIWNHPTNRFEYAAGVDTSDGLGAKISDNAVIEILRKGTAEYRDRQECEFASPDLPQKVMWPFVLALCSYYSPINQLQLAIECNQGYELQNAMIARGWWNLFEELDEGRVSHDSARIRKYGFKTTASSRPAIINNFSSFLKGKYLELFSMPLVGEIKDLQKIINPTTRKSRIEGGLSGDDRFMTICITLYALWRMAILGFEKKSWEERKEEDAKIEIQQFKGYSYERFDELQQENFSAIVSPEAQAEEYSGLEHMFSYDW